jgi:hypothetical protein
MSNGDVSPAVAQALQTLALSRARLQGAMATPPATVAIDALQAWWKQQPWRATTQQLAAALRTQISPLLRRHPVAVVLGAVALGGALVWARPWRWALASQQWQPLRSRVVDGLLAQLAALPMQSLLAAWLASINRPPPSQAPPATSPASTDDEA